MQWKKNFTRQIGKAVVWVVTHPEKVEAIFELMLDVIDWMMSM